MAEEKIENGYESADRGDYSSGTDERRHSFLPAPANRDNDPGVARIGLNWFEGGILVLRE